MKHGVVRRTALITLGLVLLVAFAWVAAQTGPLAPTRVTAEATEVGELAPILFGIGTVEARRAFQIGPTASGRVKAVRVDVGDTVKAGQLLAEMDAVDLDERLIATDAGLARARSLLHAAEAQLRDALARHDFADSTASRYAELGKQQYVSQTVVDGKLQEKHSAEAGLSAARASVEAARQELGRLTAEREGLIRLRDHVRLYAPADGVVTARDVEPGSTVVAGQSILRMMDPSGLWIKVRLDQGRSAGLAMGLKADIQLRSRPGETLGGQVARVELESDSVTEERLARVVPEPLPEGLSIGELAEVTLRLPKIPQALLVPGAAVKRQEGREGVWQIDVDGRARFKPITTGARAPDGRVQVVAGLRAGEPVIVHSERELRAGQRLKVVESLMGGAT